MREGNYLASFRVAPLTCKHLAEFLPLSGGELSTAVSKHVVEQTLKLGGSFARAAFYI